MKCGAQVCPDQTAIDTDLLVILLESELSIAGGHCP